MTESYSFTRRLLAWGHDLLPFGDAVSEELPLGRLARLGLFQVSVGMAMALLLGTMNRVLIVELRVPSLLVGAMIAIPMLVAPFRAVFGFRSDEHRSVFGWRRVPFIWAGTMMQFFGLTILPFALIQLSQFARAPRPVGYAAAALACLLVGAGAHLTQTAGLALATDLASERTRPRVVGLLYLFLLLGTVAYSFLFGWLLRDFSTVRLVQVIQTAAVMTMALNLIAIWKQEPQVRDRFKPGEVAPPFREAWALLRTQNRTIRLLVAVGLGAFAFNLQDLLLEPYGGEILGLSVGATTILTAMMALGGLAAMGLSARWLERGGDAIRLAALGALLGCVGFLGVIFASPLQSGALFQGGALFIGLGEGLFAIGTLARAMQLPGTDRSGLVLGAWGAVFATCEGAALLLSGGAKDWLGHLAASGALGPALTSPTVPYSLVYHAEVLLLFGTLIALGPLVAPAGARRAGGERFGLAELPG